MPENFVSREEFNGLKQEVQGLKIEMNENKGLLQQIDKKIDVISERISNGDKIDELKLKPLNDRIERLESSHVWLQRTVGATVTNTEITDTTLISQLEAIYNAPLYEQTNITQTNNDLPMILDITACKDNINGIKAFIRK